MFQNRLVRILIVFAKVVAIGAAFAYVFATIWRNVGSLRDVEFTLRPLPLLLSFPLAVAYLFGRGVIWHLIVRRVVRPFPLRSDLLSWMSSLVGKYLPGKVFLLFGRVYFYRGSGATAEQVSFCFLIEVCCSSLATLIVFGLGVAWQWSPALGALRPAMAVVAAGLVVATHPRVLRFLVNTALSIARRPTFEFRLRWRDMLGWTLLMSANWLILGAGFHLMLRAIIDVPPTLYPFVTGAFAVAGVIGTLALFAPSGIGVREGVMTFVLSAVLPPGVAAIAAILARVWMTLAEALCSGGAILLARGHTFDKTPPPTTTEMPETPGPSATEARREAPAAQYEDLSGVITNGMCIACGACVHADESLRLVFNDQRQMYEPSGPGNADAAAVCPAVRVDFEFLQREIFGSAEQTPLGVLENVMLAQSTDRERNLKASSGGVIKELLHWYLARDDVDGAIALRQVGGLGFEPQLIRRRDEIDTLPGSIYHNLPLDNALRILRENEGRFVLVALPCQLEGIYSYVFRCAPELRRRIHTTIGLVCGWNFTHHALRAVCKYKGIDYDRITDVAYRGAGPVGKLRITTPEGTTSVHRRVDLSYQVAFDRSFNIPRCHLCINHCNFLADIVVADAWLPSTIGTKTGISLVTCRRREAEAALRELAGAGRLRLTDVTQDEILESQSRRVALGDFSYAYADYLRELGRYCPEMIGPNRPAAQLVGRAEIERFHTRTELKTRLQRQRRYRRLWYRKVTIEIGPFLGRYIRWFLVRVLKIKSLLGMREEIEKERLEDFN